jgi:type III restriction enzyme
MTGLHSDASGSSPTPSLILNSPFEEPSAHWKYDRETRTWVRESGRRPAGFRVLAGRTEAFDDPGHFVTLALVNELRSRLKAWRESDYVGATRTTRELLEHWRDPDVRDGKRLFFCQLEAVETVLFLAEATEEHRRLINVPVDRPDWFTRWCLKLATGTGKTTVMGMLVAWQLANRKLDGDSAKYARHILFMAPGLTVRSRLETLSPTHPRNIYDEFNLVPSRLRSTLNDGVVLVRNWQALPITDPDKPATKRSVDKRRAPVGRAWLERHARELADARDILVFNDEAHHAWRKPEGATVRGVDRDEAKAAAQWVAALDRIHEECRIQRVIDLSATPFAPTGSRSTPEALFPWVVSDFGLNDAIEAGLVKTPRMVVRDDAMPNAKSYRSKLYHLYAEREVKDELNRSDTEANSPLPMLVTNAIELLATDWSLARDQWNEAGHATPPVMIIVANRTETAARVKFAIDSKAKTDPKYPRPEHTLHIDSDVLDSAEAAASEGDKEDTEGDSEASEAELNKKQRAELLRRKVNSVGQRGQPGADIECVVSVAMLSEGWDARTVTHILGLRAFASQLLCEQVVGRGLRRVSYDVNADGRFEAEYVNIYGVPFTYMPMQDVPEAMLCAPPKARTLVESLPEREALAIKWPNVTRIARVLAPRLSLDLDAVEAKVIQCKDVVQRVELASALEGKSFVDITEIELDKALRQRRLQQFVFDSALRVFDKMKPEWPARKEALLGALIRWIERFVASDKLQLVPEVAKDSPNAQVVLAMCMDEIVEHIWGALRYQSHAVRLEVILDEHRPLASTGDMSAWFTTKPVGATTKSQISQCVYDSTWELTEAHELDRHPFVFAWAKNDHLDFEVQYVFQGRTARYRPDFLVRLLDGSMLILEVKGQNTDDAKAKRRALEEWVNAVNAQVRFGRWQTDVVFSPGAVKPLLDELARKHTASHWLSAERLAAIDVPSSHELVLEALYSAKSPTEEQSSRDLLFFYVSDHSANTDRIVALLRSVDWNRLDARRTYAVCASLSMAHQNDVLAKERAKAEKLARARMDALGIATERIERLFAKTPAKGASH